MKKTGFLAIAGLILFMGLAACNGGGETSQSSSSQIQPSSSTSSSSIQDTSSSVSSAQPSSSSISSSVDSSSSQSSSSSIHIHVYGDLVEGYLPSYAYDGMKDHYYCNECGQYFDADKNPVSEESLKLPKAGENIAISVNGVEKGTFTKIEQDQFVTFVAWEYKSLVVEVGDVIAITKPGDPTYKYKCFGDGNVDKDGKILTAGTVDLTLIGNANGFHLDVSGYKYQGLVVKVNDDEYPLTKVSYHEEDKETYIYGYHYFAVGDKMTVVDNVNDIVYDFEDLEDDTQWDTFDFHKGTNNEIVFDYQARFGIEFDRGGDKKISITKAFAPNDGSAFQVNYSSDKAAVDLEKMVIDETHELYDDMSWYLNHEAVINNSDMKDYVAANGYNAYYATISFAKDEMFNLRNATKDSVIKGEHLASIFSEKPNDLVSISGDYIKVLEDAIIMVFYVPYCDTISLYYVGSSSTDAYLYFGGDFIPLTADSNNVVSYNDFRVESSETLAFLTPSYSYISFTFASNYDSSVVASMSYSGYTFLNLKKAGTYSLSLDLTTNVLTVTWTLDGGEQTANYMYMLSLMDMADTNNNKSVTLTVANGKATASNVEATAGMFLSVLRMNVDDYSSDSFTTLASDVDSSIASATALGYPQMNKTGKFNFSFDIATGEISITEAAA